MKSIFLLAFVFMTVTQSYAQLSRNWQPTELQGQNINAVYNGINSAVYYQIAATTGGVYYTTDNGDNWTQSAGLPAGAAFNHIAGRVTTTYGDAFIAGNKGVYKTTDNGANWTTANGNLARINSVSFIDANKCVAVGEQAVILVTSDGGVNWQVSPVPNKTTELKSVFYIDSRNYDVFAVGASNEMLYGWYDNGVLKWDIQVLKLYNSKYLTESRSFNDIYIFGNQTTMFAWIAGDDGYIYVSRKANDKPPLFYEYKPGGTTNLNAVFSNNHGFAWAVGNDGKIVYTSNIGQTWSTQTSGTSNDLNDIYMTTAGEGWAVGDAGTILYTSNSGANWSSQSLSINESLMSINYSASNIIVTGESGTIYRSVNGGVSWTQIQSSLTDKDLMAIDFISSTTGYITGQDLTLLKTTDGGSSWAESDGFSKNDIKFSADISQKDIKHIATLSNKPYIFACTDDVVYVSTNVGETWSKGHDFSKTGVKINDITSFSVLSNFTVTYSVYLATTDGIWKNMSILMDFTEFNNANTKSKNITAIDIGSRGGDLMAYESSGLLLKCSLYNNSNWELVPSTPAFGNVNDILAPEAANTPADIYSSHVISSDNGLFYTTDIGDSWTELTDLCLSNKRITSVARSENNRILAAAIDQLNSDNNGLYYNQGIIETVLTEPADQAAGVPLSTILKWAEVHCASSYIVHLADNPAFNNHTEFTTSDNQLQVTLADFLTVYYWKVKPVFANTVVDFCAPFSFTSIAPTYTVNTNSTPSSTGHVAKDPELPAYKENSTVQLNAIPEYGYKFALWSGLEPGENDTDNPLSITVTSNRNITAHFAPMQWELTTTATPYTAAVIHRNPAFEEYDHNTDVTLSFTANTGYEFVEWTGDIGNNDPTSPVITVTITKNSNISATFLNHNYELITHASPQIAGSVTRSPDQLYFVKNTDVKLTAEANEGYIFSHWSDENGNNLSSLNPVMIHIIAEATVVANFESKTASSSKIMFSYQGILTDDNGNTVSDGIRQITFRIYDNERNGSPVWESTDNIYVKNGIINYIIGSKAPLFLNYNRNYWLGVQIENTPELTPRTPVVIPVVNN